MQSIPAGQGVDGLAACDKATAVSIPGGMSKHRYNVASPELDYDQSHSASVTLQSIHFNQNSMAPYALAFVAAVMAIPFAAAEGFIELYNGCSKNVYYQVVDQQGVLTSGALYAQNGFRGAMVNYGKEGDGISVKLCLGQTGCASPYQFEATVSDGLVYYDFSAIDGDPFKPYGSSIVEVRTSYGCHTVNCMPGGDACAFQFPGDNKKIHACNANAELQVQLCKNA